MAKDPQAAKTWTVLLMAMLTISLLLSAVDGGRGSGRRGGRRNKRGNVKCLATSMAEYKLTFFGAWSQDKFPRMYPRYRPPAQWSKLVGRTHDPAYRMWKLDQAADSALKKFAEDGDSVLYDSQPQGFHGVLDSFYAEPITSGEGRTSTFILADGSHSRVSFVVKLVPSPDWFVGVDSLDLCRRGRWRARAHVNLRPLDAGTDRGYTFTSPNWPSYPPEPVHQLTSSFPDHPASAFLYPEYPRLPRVAFVQFHRVARYVLKGSVSPLKDNRTNNLHVFGRNAAPVTVTATTTTTTSTTNIVMKMAQVVYNSTEATKGSTQTTTETTTSSEPVRGLSKSMDAASRSDSKPKAGSNALYSLFHERLEHQQVPITTESVATTPTATFVGFMKSPDSAESPNTRSSGNSVPIQQEEEKNSAETNPSMGDVQYGDAKLEDLLQEILPKVGSDSSHHFTTVKVAMNEVDETAKQEDRMSNFPTEDGSEHLHKEGFSQSSVMQPSSQWLSSKKTIPSDAKTNPYEKQDFTSTERHAVPVSSASSKSQEMSVSSEIYSGNKAVTGQLHPSHTSKYTSDNMNDTDAQVPESSELSSVTAAGTTTAAMMKMNIPKNSDHLASLSSMKLPASQSDAIKTPPQVTSGNYVKYRLGVSPSEALSTKTPSYLERTKSHSQKTIDTPQFPKVSMENSFANSEPVDCQVKKWSDWSACSKTCGFGVRTRSRDVMQHSRNGGLSCPVLEQETLCGSMRNCQWQHFSFLSDRKRLRRVRRRRRHHERHHRTLAQRRRLRHE